MSSPARKQAESEFDDLLGHLVDELAMTPPAESAVSLIPEPPKARVDSTNEMAAEAAAAAAQAVPAAKSDNTIKVVGILAGSLTAVAVAALLVFGGGLGEQPEAAGATADAEVAAAEQLAAAQAAGTEAEDALRAAVDANRTALEAEASADADEIAKAKAAAEAAAAEAAEAAKKTRKRRSRPKTTKPKKEPGLGFDDL